MTNRLFRLFFPKVKLDHTNIAVNWEESCSMITPLPQSEAYVASD